MNEYKRAEAGCKTPRLLPYSLSMLLNLLRRSTATDLKRKGETKKKGEKKGKNLCARGGVILIECAER